MTKTYKMMKKINLLKKKKMKNFHVVNKKKFNLNQKLLKRNKKLIMKPEKSAKMKLIKKTNNQKRITKFFMKAVMYKMILLCKI